MREDYGLVFNAAEIREKGGLTVKKALEPELFADVLAVPAEVVGACADLVFSIGGESLLLEGVLQADLHIECARCGCFFTTKFSETFDEVYEDAVESLDVRGPLIESLSLMMPLKPLCTPACKGLCPACGANLNLKTCGCVAENRLGRRTDKKESPFNILKNPPGKSL
jgi:uncharacterized protein